MQIILKNILLPLSAFSLEVDIALDKRAVGIFGPSGAGKTSLLDIIAGLRRPVSALIKIGDITLTDTSRGIFVPPRERGIGYVPQDLVLFPHMTVRQNLLYGHKAKGNSNNLFSLEHVTEVLEMAPLLPRGVLDLSGGEKQRVALARALMTCPRILLLDEPLAGLDYGLKSRILPFLIRARDEFQLPMLYVTHDHREVDALCHEVLVMDRGRILKQTNATDRSWLP